MFVAPLEGWRRGEVTEKRTRKDWAEQIRKLVEEDFPLTGRDAAESVGVERSPDKTETSLPSMMPSNLRC
jgi:hypothetical protein